MLCPTYSPVTDTGGELILLALLVLRLGLLLDMPVDVGALLGWLRGCGGGGGGGRRTWAGLGL
jgi:hypothetical protein